LKLKGIPSKSLNRMYEAFSNVSPLSFAEVDYENPQDMNDKGKIYATVSGIPKLIEIRYVGKIRINPDYNFNPNIKIIAYCDKNIILVRNRYTNPIAGLECLLEYTGSIKYFQSVNVYGYNGRPILLKYDRHLDGLWSKTESTWANDESFWNANEQRTIDEEGLDSTLLQSKSVSRSVEKLSNLHKHHDINFRGRQSLTREPAYFTNIKENE